MLDQDNPSTDGEELNEGTSVDPSLAADDASGSTGGDTAEKPTKKAARKPAKKAATKRPARKRATAPDEPALELPLDAAADEAAGTPDITQRSMDAPETTETTEPAKKPAKKAAAKRTRKKAAATPEPEAGPDAGPDAGPGAGADEEAGAEPAAGVGGLLFQPPVATTTTTRRSRGRGRTAKVAAPEPQTETQTETQPETAEAIEESTGDEAVDATDSAEPTESLESTDADNGDDSSTGRRKRRRGGRRRRKSGDGDADATESSDAESDASADETAAGAESEEQGGEGTTTRRRRRRRRAGEDGGEAGDDPKNTVTRVRRTRSSEDEITAVSGSTRLEAKKQRRREGREAGRRRAPIVSEAEFLARRESVDRVMVIRQHEDITQIAVIEDKVLVEHYVARESQTSLIGNVYLGRVQNVLPSMEAAFVDIGKGRNAVLYAGEVNWSALGHKDGQPRKIESVLSSGQPILVQVTKDPIGHKGARLTSQVSLAGRFLVYVPDGTTSGISRKLPDTERNRLKTLLKEIVPDTAGVIVRTAAEGASEDELTRDVERLKARWEDIERKAKGQAPQLLYGEPDLTLKVVRDLFTEDFSRLVIDGQDAWETVQGYVQHVAPDLEPRLERYDGDGRGVFAAYRVEEQIHKGLDRKVWLPSGGSLVIDRTEAMTVVDVNTGKFTGSGGNLEETVTKNNLEAAEEIVRQLRLRDIGGIIVVDFIDMVLESNRDLVLRRLVECLGRDRTRHQVAEVTSLGLVQMTRKRIGTGLLESFSHDCEACNGRGVVVEDAPVEPRRVDEEGRRGRRPRGGRGEQPPVARTSAPSPRDVAAVAKPHPELDEDEPTDDLAGDLADDLADDVSDDLSDDVADDAPEVIAEATTEPVVQEPEIAAEPEPEPEPGPEPEDAAPAAPEPTRVVTRSRRRAASRPAGPPPVVASENGSPAAGAILVVDGSGAGSDRDKDRADGTARAPLHVPVKRRGSRKR